MTATEMAARLGERVSEGAETAREVAGEAVAVVTPAGRSVASTIADAVRSLLAAVAAAPRAVAELLEALQEGLGAVAERGRQVADEIPLSRRERRRRRLQLLGVFLGGFTAGAATGWFVRARQEIEAERQRIIEEHTGPSPYGPDADPIDARSQAATAD